MLDYLDSLHYTARGMGTDDQRFKMRLVVERAPTAMWRGKPALQRVSRKQAACGAVRTRWDAEVRRHPGLMRGTRKRQDCRGYHCGTEQDSSARPEHRFYNPSAVACVRSPCGLGAGFLDTLARWAAPRSS